MKSDRPCVRRSGKGPRKQSSKSEEIVSIKDRTDALVRGFHEVSIHHGMPAAVLESLSDQLHAYLDTSLDERVWLKRSKYVCTFPLAKYLRNERPPEPDCPFRPTGSLRKWIKNRINGYSNKNTHLWYSWLQAKRASLPASKDFIFKTYQEHFDALTSPDPGDELAISAVFSDPTFEHVLHRVRNDLKYAIACGRKDQQISRLTASNSACFERTRSQRGQHGELRRICGLAPSTSGNYLKTIYLDFDNISHTDEFVRMDFYPKVSVNKTVSFLFDRTVETRISCGMDLWSDLDHLSDEVRSSVSPLSCIIQGVLEPFKVRVISKGEALPYYSARWLQKVLHGSLTKIPCFRLLSRPFCPTDLIGLKRKASKTDVWFSVDYSAATDGLSWKYSSRILRYILDQESPGLMNLAMKVLGPHRLFYHSDPNEHECGLTQVEEWGLQQNGQLMGSILSFPILCLANLGVYLVTTRLHQEHWSNRERLNHVLVNGDDMVYAAPIELWERHIKVGKDVGLTMSVGKAYHHNSYANINSTSVVYPIDGDNLPKQISFLNTGLFFGCHKVQGKDEKRDLAEAHTGIASTIVGNTNQLLSGSLPGRESILLGRFLHQNREAVLDETKCGLIVLTGQRRKYVRSEYHRNLFLPISLGGMGVTPPIGWKFRITRMDLVVAKQFCCEYKGLGLTTQLPLPGPEPKSALNGYAPHEKVQTSPDKTDFIIRHEGRLTRRHLPRTGIRRFADNPYTLML